MVSFWARIVTIVTYFTASPSQDDNTYQHPLHVETEALSNAASTYHPPDFVPPGAPDDFECKYPKLKDYKSCSTNGDRSCWLKSSDPKKPTYNISTDYENIFPEGIVRKVSPSF